METSASVDFDNGGNLTGSAFFPAVTAQAQYAAGQAAEFMRETGFGFFAVFLLLVVLSLGVWRRLTRSV